MTLNFTHVSWRTDTDQSAGQLSHSVSLLPLLFSYVKNTNKRANRQTQEPAVPVTPVTFLISSELLSMPAVKRFSVSFARHPSNGMSAFIKAYFDTPPDLLILHELFVGKHFLCFLFVFFVFFWEFDVWLRLITFSVYKIKNKTKTKQLEFLFDYTLQVFVVSCVFFSVHI